jgi:signal transduction histidine kinase
MIPAKKTRVTHVQQLLMYLWLVAFIPFILIELLFAYSWITSRYNFELSSSQELAQSVNLTFNAFVNDIVREEVMLGVNVTTDFISKDISNNHFEIAVKTYNEVEQFLFITKSGEPFVSSHPAVNKNVIDSFFSIMPETSNVVIGDLQNNMFGSKPGFIIAQKVITNSQLQGFILAMINPVKFSQGIMKLQLVEQGMVALFDRKGNLVYSNLFPDLDFHQRTLWHKTDRLLLRAMNGTPAKGVILTPIDKIKRVGARIPIPIYHWVAGVSRPQSVVLQPIINNVLISILLTLIAITITVILGRNIIASITNALKKLQHHAKALSSGNFEFKTPESGIKEFDSLILDFNQLGIQLKNSDEKVKSRTEELQRSNAELGQFAYISSHDLQEPLRTIAGYLQLIERRYKGKLDKDADEFIDFAVGGAHRLQSIINDLLQFSRVGTRGKPFVRVDVNTIIQDVVESMQNTIENSGAEINYSDLPIIYADSNQLRQLFQNLISNSIKFRKGEPPEIRITATRQEDKWLFTIYDNGIGISAEYYDKIFIAFKRLHTQDKYPGTGIGLAICRKIVERHGGRIWVESITDKGSTFYFTIPDRKEHEN